MGLSASRAAAEYSRNTGFVEDRDLLKREGIGPQRARSAEQTLNPRLLLTSSNSPCLVTHPPGRTTSIDPSSAKKGGTAAFLALLEEANVGAFQANGVASTQNEVPQVEHRVMPSAHLNIFLSLLRLMVAHRLLHLVTYNFSWTYCKIQERPYLFHWYSLHGCGLLCQLVVETRKRILSLNVVPGDSITRRISVRTPVKLQPYSRCRCLQ